MAARPKPSFADSNFARARSIRTAHSPVGLRGSILDSTGKVIGRDRIIVWREVMRAHLPAAAEADAARLQVVVLPIVHPVPHDIRLLAVVHPSLFT